MSINIQMKNDVSYLFSGLNSKSTNVMDTSFLSDYASIKNGSYGKLMKAYYSEVATDDVKSVVNSQKKALERSSRTREDYKKYASVETSSDALKDAADDLLDKALYEKKEITEKNADGTESTRTDYDTNAIYKAVNSFVKNYNAVVAAAEETDDATVSRRVENLMNNTESNSAALKAVGITVGEDGALTLDKDTLLKADVSKVQKLFQQNGSYGYQASAQASLVSFAADNVMNRGSVYTEDGSYSANFSNGNLFSTYF